MGERGDDVWVALLRGINLGARNKVPKATLLEVFAAAGAADVRTYLQSGNVLFRCSPGAAAGIGAAATDAIRERLGLEVPVVLRDARELRAAVDGCPFVAAGDDPAGLHALFLGAPPDPAAVAALPADHGAARGDRWAMGDGVVYLSLAGGAHATRLSGAWFERRLSVVVTARNWRTTTALADLAAAMVSDPTGE